ncbi:MAG: asparagine synthase (glutamine-hydrolyzing) [Gammaproteobacteria bacterium]
MCGIAGFIDFGGHSPDQAEARVRRMSDAILHRGPDEGDVYVDRYAALGHRRLAIIDLSSGQQPMSVLDGRVQIVFNGEIYNYLELRQELIALGHSFKTKCDTEVILVSYLQWGAECVRRLSGMFAFALWDTRSRSVLLARDRVGKKPLYICRRGSVLAFASELKALRAAGFTPTQLDPAALDCYFTFGYIPAPRTIYAGVSKLPAGHYRVDDASGGREQRYWSLSFADPRPRSAEEAAEEFESLFDEAVRCRLMSEVPLGAFLSGGLDSTLVVSSMARAQQRPVITNSIGFEERDASELPLARTVANHLGTDHHEFIVQPKAADVLPKIAWHFDEPVADSSALPTWYVCEMARRTVTVAISGDGGDESFGGYTFRYLPHVMESRIRGRIPAALRVPVFGTLGSIWPASARLPRPLRLKTIFENLAVSDEQAFYQDLGWLRADARTALYSSDFMNELRGFTPREVVHSFYGHSDATDALGRGQFTDIHLYMTDDVLVKVDRMSMAHSLEVRSPLLDHRIIEFAAKLPSALKMNSSQGKLPLRALAAKRLPAEVLNAPKRGFSIPAARWLRGELRPMAEEVLFDSSGSLWSLLDRQVVRRMWNEHLSGARDHNVFMWGLMMFGLWERAAAGSRETAAGIAA